MITTVIIPAAGIGERFGADIPKQFYEINSKPLIIHTLETFENINEIDNIILSLHKDWIDFTKEIISRYNINKVKEFVIGGAKRQDSIYNALLTKTVQNSDIILVHDAVRPYTSSDLIKNIINSADNFGAAIPGIPLNDTIKSIDKDSFVLNTPERQNLRAVQTPQGFKRDIILHSYQNAKEKSYYSTDDASLAEFAGYKVKIIRGEISNIKITTKSDIV